jgi:hypothetical protein
MNNYLQASLGASVVAGVTSTPFDVAKSRLQQMRVRSKDGKFPYKGTIGTNVSFCFELSCFVYVFLLTQRKY